MNLRSRVERLRNALAPEPAEGRPIDPRAAAAALRAANALGDAAPAHEVDRAMLAAVRRVERAIAAGRGDAELAAVYAEHEAPDDAR